MILRQSLIRTWLVSRVSLCFFYYVIDFVRLPVSQTVILSGVLKRSKIVSNYKLKRIVINLTGLERKDHKGKYDIGCEMCKGMKNSRLGMQIWAADDGL